MDARLSDAWSLVLEVWDKDRGPDDFLGEVSLHLGDVFELSWVGTTVSRHLALDDPSGRLRQKEKKLLIQRQANGSRKPYGTIDVRLSYTELTRTGSHTSGSRWPDIDPVTQVDSASSEQKKQHAEVDVHEADAAETTTEQTGVGASEASAGEKASTIVDELDTVKEVVSATKSTAMLLQSSMGLQVQEQEKAAAEEARTIAEMGLEADAQAGFIATLALRMEQTEATVGISASLAQVDAQALAHAVQSDGPDADAKIELAEDAAAKSSKVAATDRAIADAARDAHAAAVGAEKQRAEERSAVLAVAKAYTVACQAEVQKTTASLATANREHEAAMATSTQLLQEKLDAMAAAHVSHTEAVETVSKTRTSVERAEAAAATSKAQVAATKAALSQGGLSAAQISAFTEQATRAEAAEAQAAQLLQDELTAMQTAQASEVQKALSKAEAKHEADQVASVTSMALKEGYAAAIGTIRMKAGRSPTAALHEMHRVEAEIGETARAMEQTVAALEAVHTAELESLDLAASSVAHTTSELEIEHTDVDAKMMPFTTAAIPHGVGAMAQRGDGTPPLGLSPIKTQQQPHLPIGQPDRIGSASAAAGGVSSLEHRVNSLLPESAGGSPVISLGSTSTRQRGSPLSASLTPSSPRTNWRNPVLGELQAHLQRLSP